MPEEQESWPRRRFTDYCNLRSHKRCPLTSAHCACRLKPRESWAGEMVIRLHEPSIGSMSTDENEEASEDDA